MEHTHIVKSLNMSAVEILTLEKSVERLEFEALPFNTTSKVLDCECDGTLYCKRYKV